MLEEKDLNPLIEAYQIREPLWNLTLPEYFIATTRSQLWEEMAVVLKLSVKDIQNRIKNLRTVYSRYRKGAASGSRGGQTAERRDWLLEKLNFCDKYIVAKETQSTLDRPSQQASVQEQSPESELAELEGDVGSSISTQVSQAATAQPSTSQVSAPQSSAIQMSAAQGSQSQTQAPGRKRKKEDPMLTSLNTITNVMSAFVNRPRAADDTDTLFGQFVACELRACNNQVIKSVVRSKISDVLVELRGIPAGDGGGDGPAAPLVRRSRHNNN